MALPKIVQKLFSDEGKGSKLRPDIVPITMNGNSPDPEGNFTPDQTGCLPLSGGKMAGGIQFGGNIGYLECLNTNGYFQATGAPWGSGARITLYGKDRSENGAFSLMAQNATYASELLGSPDGTLTFGGKHLVRSVNGTFADANGDVTLTVGGSNAYKIPFGTCTAPSTTPEKVATITNGAPFSLEPGSIVAIKFSNEPTNFTTLNVNSSGAKEVRKHLLFGEMEDTFSNGFIAIAPSNLVFVFVFDGTYWNLVSAYGEGEIYGIS